MALWGEVEGHRPLRRANWIRRFDSIAYGRPQLNAWIGVRVAVGSAVGTPSGVEFRRFRHFSRR